MKTFYSHLDDYPIGAMQRLFRDEYGLEEVKNPANADVIIWNGGEDIGTSIYGDRPALVGQILSPSKRDTQEIGLFEEYKGKPSKLLLGVCRGSQLLNCLNGGKLYQHVDNHSGSHDMIDLRTKEIIKVTSTHHQQMRPNPKEGEIIGVASRSTLKIADGVQEHPHLTKELQFGVDVEIMWYPKTHTLCIQGHPEYVPGTRFSTYTWELLSEAWASIKKEPTECAA